MRRILSILRIDIIEVPGERQPRRRHRANYSDPPSQTIDFLRGVAALTPDEVTAFDTYCHVRGLPLNLDSLYRFELHRERRMPLPARVQGGRR